MAEPPVYTLRWGIMATGHVAERFVKDILTDPATRGVFDVRHEIRGIASSTSKSRVADFCVEVKAPAGISMYASYIELVTDPNVDIIYVATPASHHFQNAMLAIEAGKSVLCEKPFTVTASQAKILVAAARTRGLFLLEAVWTRFLPLSKKVCDLVASGTVGKIYRVIADNSLNRGLPDGGLDWDDSHRMVNLDLGGGAMLDLGIYSLTWIMQILYHRQPGEERQVPSVISSISKYHTGIDETTSFIVKFPDHKSMGIGMTSFRIASGVDYNFTAGPPIRIQGTGGEIQVFGPAFKPTKYCIFRRDGNGQVETEEFAIPKDESREGWGHGLYWEADECARCIRNGRLESDVLPLNESLIMMELMESILGQGGVQYPVAITSGIYNPEHVFNTSKF
ncbi:hypothetical protein FDECE_2834 [Fusarium decemcellulare]|nr:hypothetical protein FDECE_2834 [Fusarium decemcellulare]